jgi:predicted metal-dependent phosphoesterase TrpH
MRLDLHIHSNHSDGKSGVREILKYALKKGLDAISITDHDTLNGSLEAVEIVEEEKLPIRVIKGVEITTMQGHILAYGIEKEIDPGMDLIEVVEIVRDLGGITSLAHPFQFYRKGVCNPRYFKVVDCVEVFNARSLPIFNRLSDFVRRIYGKGITAGSDAHRSEFVGCGVVLIDRSEIVNDVLEVLKAGRCRVEGRLDFKNVFWRLRCSDEGKRP